MDKVEQGLIFGIILKSLEAQNEITFTQSMDCDKGLLELANRFICEFEKEENSYYKYFSEFVTDKLISLESKSLAEKTS